MADETNLEGRLVELESRSMHQERLIDELNGIVIEQRKQIDRLERKLARLTEQVRNPSGDDGQHDEAPPHY